MENFNFSSDYQDLILACWMRFPEKFDMYGGIMREEYFSGMNSRLTAKCIIECVTRSGTSPTPTVLGDMLYQQLTKVGVEEQVEDAQAYVQKLASIDTRNVSEVKDRVVLFCKERAIVEVCLKVVESCKANTRDKINPIELMESALMVGSEVNELGLHLNSQYQEVIDRVTSSTYGIRTGYPIFDDIWKTGWGLDGW